MSEEQFIIVSREQIRGHWTKLTFEDGSEINIDRDVLLESEYVTENALTAEQLSALLASSSKRRAMNKAFWLLSKRDYSEKELKDKLYKEADAETICVVLEYLKDRGYIDDESYAKRHAEDYKEFRHYPSRRIVEKLCEKGICRETAKIIVEEMTTDDEASAIALLHKKCYTQSMDLPSRQKLQNYLVRQGFSYDVIHSAMRRIDNGEDV